MSGGLPSARTQLAKVWPAALLAGAITLAVKFWLGSQFGVVEAVAAEWGGSVLAPPALPRIPMSLGLLGLYCALYGMGCIVLKVPQATAIVRRVLRRKS